MRLWWWSLCCSLLLPTLSKAFSSTHWLLVRVERRNGSLRETKGDDDNDRPSVAIVGGGVGGLAIACRISAAAPSCKVTLFEKNQDVGGRCGSFDVIVPGAGTFRHERGPSLLLLPDVYKQVFTDTGWVQRRTTD